MNKILKIKAQIPAELIKIGEEKFKRKDARKNLYKMYAMIKYHYQLELKRNKKRSKPKFDSLVHAPLSSTYFEKVISRRYYIYKKILVDGGFITPKMNFVWRAGTPLFGDSAVETYCVGKVSKSFKTIENIEGAYIEMEFDLTINHSVAATKNLNFLESIGVENPRIFYDKYGYRLYHNLSSTYKCYITNKEDFVYYDIKSSVPSFLKNLMEKEGVTDDPYYDLFESDFYINLGNLVGFKGCQEEVRGQAKKLFMHVVYGAGKMNPSVVRILKDKLPRFELMTRRKGIGRDLIHQEANFINKLILPSIGIDSVLTIFDAILIHRSDEKIADHFFEEFETFETSIKFEKGEVPECKCEEEVSYAA